MIWKKYLLLAIVLVFLRDTSSKLCAQTSLTYSYTGSMQTFTVPNCVAFVTIEVAGAEGTGMSGYIGGQGGIAKAVLPVTIGQVLNIFVGGQNSYNGGGPGQSGAHGGGASDVRVGGIAITDRVIVAGGGGGSGGDNWNCLVGTGYGGGGIAVGTNFVGGAGGAGWTSGTGCGSSGANNGGAGGSGWHGGGGGGGGFISGGLGGQSVSGTGATGSLGIGGSAYSASLCIEEGTGAGGGGYFGGGGAAGDNCGAGQGGGGSSWTGTLTSPSFTSGGNLGNGYAKISYDFIPPSIPITGTSPNQICYGTTMTLTATGVPNYTWSNGSQSNSIVVTPTSNTTYSVFYQGVAPCPAHGIFPTTVIALPIITATASPNFISCPGTSITLSGGGADSYSWSGGVTNLNPFPVTATTIFTVIGTNTTTGCSNTHTILVPIYITTVGISSASSICAGSSATLLASGAISYTWSTNSQLQQTVVSPTLTSVYSVSATTSDFCVATNTTMVTVEQFPTVVAMASSTNICREEVIELTASGASSYSWNTGSTTSSISVSPTVSTTYSVIGASSIGCSSNATIFVKVSICLGFHETNSHIIDGVKVYPNPSSGNFSIQSNREVQLNLVNALGQVLKVLDLNQNNSYRINIEGLISGIYFLTSEKDGKKFTQKLIVN